MGMDTTIIPTEATSVNNSVVIAENAYRTLQNDGAFTNGKNIAVDEFTDSNGVKNTKTGGTATYDATNDYFHNVVSEGSQIGSTDTATYTEGSGTGTGWILVQTYSAINQRIFKWTNVKRVTSNTLTASVKVKFVYTDATSAESSGDLAWTSTSWSGTVNYVNPNPLKVVDYVELYCQQSHSSYNTETKDQKYYAVTANSTDTVICSSGLMTLLGTENKICVFADADIPSGSEITYDVSDGTDTVSGLALNDLNDISGLGTGNLTVTFNLNNTSDYAYLRGYSVIVTR